MGRIFNIQRYSLQDGPGLRTTVFLKGCPLACAWCHNPESQAGEKVLVTQEGRCIACGCCEPAVAAGLGDEAVVEACPTGARQLLGRDLTVPGLLDIVLRDRIFFDESGGGVTFSGGEPLAQPAFLLEALRALRARGVHTALDTCGLAPREDLLAAAALSDVVLYDLKLMDEARHREWTGAGNGRILENLEVLGHKHPELWIRIPVIPGINDTLENMDAAAGFISRLPGVKRLDLLPYHRTGAAKFRRLGREYLLDQLQTPSHEHMEALAAPFRTRGLAVTLGGNA